MTASSSNAPVRVRSGSVATSSEFFLPAEIPIDTAHTLDQLTNRFRAVKDGLPELIKNSKDQYSRHRIYDRSSRQIVVIADTERHRLGVLDFAGARTADFDGWTTWSSRTAGRNELSTDIEAGHGNGGKAFMVRGATDTAYLESCFEGRRTRMGFRNNRPADRYKPGYVNLNGVKLCNIADLDTKTRLEEFLKSLGTSSKALPSAALAAFQKRNAFTGLLLVGMTEWDGRQRRKVKRLAEEVIPSLIANHGQTAMTIETCDVWVIVDGKLITSEPIAPIKLAPYPGFEQPLRFEIPDILADPETGDSVDMVCGKQSERYLQLSTSAKQLQMSDDTKARNVIRLWNDRNNVGNWPLQSLGVQITSVSFIYGEIHCPTLVGDHLAGAERVHLNDTPLVRALEAWTREKVAKLAEDLHRAMMGENRPRDRERAKNALESIRNLMRRYLDPDSEGEDSDDENVGETGEGDKGKKRKRRKIYWGTRLDEIVLEQGTDEIVLALGTTVPLRSKCTERQEDGTTKPVKVSKLQLCCSTPNLVFSGATGGITAKATGSGEIWLESDDGRVTSNKVRCKILAATDVSVRIPEEPLLQGQRVKLPVTFQTDEGPRDDLLIEGLVDEPGMGLIGRNGRFIAGSKEGQATIRIRYGGNATDQRAFVIPIGPNRVTPPDAEGSRGSDIPEILLCGDIAPGMEDFPVEQRTLAGGEEQPTIIEDPLFPNIVWINPTSKESMRVRGGRGGPTGVGRISSANFMHFVALKCFDVLKRLHVRQALKGQTVTEYQFIQAAAYAEMECADFIDAAWEMSDELLKRAEDFGAQID